MTIIIMTEIIILIQYNSEFLKRDDMFNYCADCSIYIKKTDADIITLHLSGSTLEPVLLLQRYVNSKYPLLSCFNAAAAMPHKGSASEGSASFARLGFTPSQYVRSSG